ncbi:MAG: DTW domain-containing protein [Epsilonproteobacteria bacterium]|nr:MAG: DTW domain-containing protein [Campylobacterota bacterium]
MNLEKYLQLKAARQKALEEEFGTYRKLCLKCLRSEKACFCESLNSFETWAEFRILMHPKEAKSEKVGTGRLANICLENCKIIMGIDFSKSMEIQSLLKNPEYSPMVLYPGENSHNISERPLKIGNKRPLIFVIDGTWACAKTMMRESRVLHHLPRISFNSDTLSRFAVKLQPDSRCLSTIESIHKLLDGLNSWEHENLGEKHDILPQTLDRLVQDQIACMNDPSRKIYRPGNPMDKKEIKGLREWDKRKLFFEEKNYRS